MLLIDRMWPMVTLNYSLNRYMKYVRQILYENPPFNLLVWAHSGSPQKCVFYRWCDPTNVQLWLKLPTVDGKETVEREDKILELAIQYVQNGSYPPGLSRDKSGLDE